MIIDTHAHLTDSQYDNFREELISSFSNDKIAKVFTVAYDKQSIISAVELAQKHPQVYAIIGIHPSEVQDWNESTISLIRQLSTHPKVVAIGEIGLDYHYEGFDKEEQKRVFVEQLQLAHELQLPISIHNRDSIGDCLTILKENSHLLSNGGVVHCFSESIEVYKEIKKLGLKIAFGGSLTFKNSVVAPSVCKIADLDDILLETDCPYLTPHPYRGSLNQPKYTSLVAQKISEIKGISYDTVVQTTTANALKLFKKAVEN